jgi:hypothetical protein
MVFRTKKPTKSPTSTKTDPNNTNKPTEIVNGITPPLRRDKLKASEHGMGGCKTQSRRVLNGRS